MSVEISQGTQVAIAATFGASKNMTAITNAAEAVATLEASHGVVENDILVMTSGWDRLNNRVVRADSVATNDVTLEDIDTSSTANYPTGGGTGTVKEVATWATITQIQNFAGEAPSVEFVDITTLADQTRKEIPGLENASGGTLTILYDPALSWVATVRAASDANALTPIRLITPAGRIIYGNAYWKLSQFPQVATGQPITTQITFRLAALVTTYAS